VRYDGYFDGNERTGIITDFLRGKIKRSWFWVGYAG